MVRDTLGGTAGDHGDLVPSTASRAAERPWDPTLACGRVPAGPASTAASRSPTLATEPPGVARDTGMPGAGARRASIKAGAAFAASNA
jgi:hypothetical protein